MSMRTRRVTYSSTLTLMVALATAGCGAVVNPVSPDSNATSASDATTDAQFCVDEVNRLRASAGKAPLEHSEQIETFSSEAARVDGDAHETHKFFRQTNGGGVARAENEIPWWKLSRYGSVRAIIREGLANEWAEGPGGSHWENIVGNYANVACGIAIKDGEVTVTQDFH
jgi:GH24 family phage-related lysozyme (muramidase)